MHPVMERSAERLSRNDRAMPKVPGAGVQLTGEFSTGHWRTRKKEGSHPFVATSARRFGVKPNSGRVPDTIAGQVVPGKDDGSDYFTEWRESGAENQLPKAKTRAQDHLHKLCVAYIAGQDLGETIEQGMRDFIAKILATDPEHGREWRLAMGIAGLYR